METKFKSLCHTTHPHSSYKYTLQAGEIYDIVMKSRITLSGTSVSFYVYRTDAVADGLYDGEFMTRFVDSFTNYFYTAQQMRDMKLDKVLQ